MQAKESEQGRTALERKSRHPQYNRFNKSGLPLSCSHLLRLTPSKASSPMGQMETRCIHLQGKQTAGEKKVDNVWPELP